MQNRQIQPSMSRERFEITMSVFKRVKTVHALDGTVHDDDKIPYTSIPYKKILINGA
jgi:hypothetical protein